MWYTGWGVVNTAQPQNIVVSQYYLESFGDLSVCSTSREPEVLGQQGHRVTEHALPATANLMSPMTPGQPSVLGGVRVNSPPAIG